MALAEELELDVGPAISSVDQLEQRISTMALGATGAIADAIQAGVDQGLQSIAQLDQSITDISPIDIPVDTADITEADAATQSLSDAISQVDADAIAIPVDASQLDGATDAAASLDDTLQATGEPVTIDVDASGIDTTTTALDDLLSAEQAVSAEQVSVSVDSSGADEASSSLDQYAQSATSAGGASVAAEAGAGSFFGRLGSGAPVTAAAVAGVGALGFGLDKFVEAGQRSLQGTERLNRAYGDMAEQVQEIHLAGLNTDLQTLTISTGSSAAGLKIAISNLAELGKATGASDEDLLKTGRAYGLLANYVAATRPELGGAEQVANRLTQALSRGGRAALGLGLPLNSTAEVIDRASSKYGKASADLSTFEKASAGLDITLERLGPSLKENLDVGVETPTVKLRALEAQLKAVIAEAAKPVTVEFTKALEDAEPLADGLTRSIGGLAVGGVRVLAGGLEAVSGPLALVARLLEAIPTPVFAGAAAFAVGAAGYAKLASVATSLGSKLAGVASSIGDGGVATALRSTVSASTASAAQLERVAATSGVLRQSQQGLRASLEATALSNEKGVVALAAHDAQIAKSIALSDAQIVVRQREVEAEAAATAARSGSEADLAAYAIAMHNLAVAKEAEVVATEQLAIAEGEASVAIAGAAATTEGAAAGVATASATTTAAAAESSAAMAAAGGEGLALSSALGPIGIAAGIAVAGLLLLTSSAGDSDEAIQAATESIAKYREELGLTNAELSNLPTSQAQSDFQAAGATADEFIATLKDRSVEDDFQRKGLSIAQVTAALNGNVEAAERFRRSLVGVNEVNFRVDDRAGTTIKITAAELRKLQDEYIRTGTVRRDALGGATNVTVQEGLIPKIFRDEVAAAQEATAAYVTKARIELQGKKITADSAVANLAATGQLGLLGEAGERTARKLLGKADAEKKDRDASREASTSQQELAEAYGSVGESAGRALDAISSGDQPDLSGLQDLRDLAADPGFADLPQETQDLVTKQLALADSARTAAADQGLLVDRFGETSTSIDELEDKLDSAISKYQELSGSTADTANRVRDTQQAIADLPAKIQELGPPLNAGATFDAAFVSVENYTDILSKLPKAQQDAINAIGSGDGGSDKTAAKVALVRGEIERLRAIGQEPVTGLLERLTSKNADAIEKLLPKEVQIRIDLQVDEVSDTKQSKSAIEAQKAAATRAAVARLSQTEMAKLNEMVGANSAQINDYFDDVGSNVRAVIGDLLKSGTPIRDILTTVGQFRDQITQAATSVGVPIGYVNELLEREHLLEPQIVQDFELSGVDEAQRKLETLKAALSGLPPAEVETILKIEDPEKQRAAIDQAIAALSPDAQIVVKAVLDAPSVAAAEQAVRSLTQPVEVAIEAGLSPDSAQKAALEIQQFQQNNPGVKIQVTADTIAAIAEMDAAAAPRTAGINADDQGTAAREAAKLDALQARRDAYIEAHVVPAAGSEEAFGWFGLKGAIQKATAQVDVQAKDMTVLGEITGKTLRVDTIVSGGGGTGTHRAAGGPGPGRAFAGGGSPRSLRDWERQQSQPRTGLYAGREGGLTFAEPSTGHEWFLSGDPAFRPENERYLGMAADDFGFDVVPKGMVPTQIGGSDPGLRAEVAGLRSVTEALLDETRANTAGIVGAVSSIPVGGDEINQFEIHAPNPQAAAFAVSDRQREKARRK